MQPKFSEQLKWSNSGIVSCSGHIKAGCRGRGECFSLSLPPLLTSPRVSQPVCNSRIIICRSEKWLRRQPEGEKTDIKMEETLSCLQLSELLHCGVEREAVFLCCHFGDSNLTSRSILITKILGHSASRYFEYHIIQRIRLVVVSFLHSTKCVFVREWQKAKFKNKIVARRCSLELLPKFVKKKSRPLLFIVDIKNAFIMVSCLHEN